MNHISNLINMETVKRNREHMEKPTAEQAKAAASVINWLFSELSGNFTAFHMAWPNDEIRNAAKRVWIKAFVLAGINNVTQIQYGLNHCYLMEKPFVPTPGEFISWCKPSPQSLGFPSTDEAYTASIVMNRQFSDYRHPDARVDTVIRHAINQIGTSTYREMKIDNAKKTFKTYYEIALRQFMEGELKVIPKALPEKAQAHPADKGRADEARKRCMDELRSKGIAINRRVQEDNIQPRC